MMVFDPKYAKISLNRVMNLSKYFSGMIFNLYFFPKLGAPKQVYDLDYTTWCENETSLVSTHEIEFNIFSQIKVASYLTNVLSKPAQKTDLNLGRTSLVRF